MRVRGIKFDDNIAELPEKVKLLEEAMNSIAALSKKLRRETYDLREAHPELARDCEYFIAVGERITQLAEKLINASEITDSDIEEAYEVLDLAYDAFNLAYSYTERTLIDFDRSYAYSVMDRAGGPQFLDILWGILETSRDFGSFEARLRAILGEFIDRLDDAMIELIRWFNNNFMSLIAEDYDSIRAFLRDVIELIENYSNSRDERLLYELARLGKKIKEYGRYAQRALDAGTEVLHETIKEQLWWLHEELENLYERYVLLLALCEAGQCEYDDDTDE